MLVNWADAIRLGAARRRAPGPWHARAARWPARSAARRGAPPPSWASATSRAPRRGWLCAFADADVLFPRPFAQLVDQQADHRQGPRLGADQHRPPRRERRLRWHLHHLCAARPRPPDRACWTGAGDRKGIVDAREEPKASRYLCARAAPCEERAVGGADQGAAARGERRRRGGRGEGWSGVVAALRWGCTSRGTTRDARLGDTSSVASL